MPIQKSKALNYFIVVGFLLALFSFGLTARAESEIINYFDTNITIQKNGSIFVTEQIAYNFGANQKHGIFRDLPLATLNGPRLNINVLSVMDKGGGNYQYTTSITNDILHLKIGDPNALISGVKTYVINYQVANAIRTFADHEELYWNATGNQWPVAIQNANAYVTLPDPAIANVRMDCFTGQLGSAEKNCAWRAWRQPDANVSYSTTRALNANEGLTIVLGMPRGYITNTYAPPPQSAATSYTSTPGNNPWLQFIPLFLAIFILSVGRSLVGRLKKNKPKPIVPPELKNQPVVVEYNPPDNLPPIEIGTLLDRRVDITDISSVIMDLAVRGYLKIRYTVKPIPFWPDKKDFELIKLKENLDLVHPADKIIFNLLFSGRESVKLSDLKEQKIAFQADIKKIKTDTEQYLYDKEYFDKAATAKSKKLIAYFLAAAAGLFIITWLAGSRFPTPGAQFISFGLLMATMIIIPFLALRWATHKLTARGIAALAKILGFREFLQLTEKDRLRILNAPELEPEIFEKFLPFAMVLGVEENWAKKFEGIYNTVPHWYEDPTAISFSSYALARNLTLFNGSFNQVFSITSPKSSSGFSGGSSGGGSGGGGGGSW